MRFAISAYRQKSVRKTVRRRLSHLSVEPEDVGIAFLRFEGTSDDRPNSIQIPIYSSGPPGDLALHVGAARAVVITSLEKCFESMRSGIVPKRPWMMCV
jgi:hypothetical protein